MHICPVATPLPHSRLQQYLCPDKGENHLHTSLPTFILTFACTILKEEGKKIHQRKA